MVSESKAANTFWLPISWLPKRRGTFEDQQCVHRRSTLPGLRISVRLFVAVLLGLSLASTCAVPLAAQDDPSFRTFGSDQLATPEKLLEQLNGISGFQSDAMISLSQNADFKRWIEDEFLSNLSEEEQRQLMEMASGAMSRQGMNSDSLTRIDPDALEDAAEDFREELNASPELRRRVEELSKVDPEDQGVDFSPFLRELAGIGQQESWRPREGESANNAAESPGLNQNGANGSPAQNGVGEQNSSNQAGQDANQPGRNPDQTPQQLNQSSSNSSSNSANDPTSSNRSENSGRGQSQDGSPLRGAGSNSGVNRSGSDPNGSGQSTGTANEANGSPANGGRTGNNEQGTRSGAQNGTGSPPFRTGQGNGSPQGANGAQANGGNSNSANSNQFDPAGSGSSSNRQTREPSPPPTDLFPRNQINEDLSEELIRQLRAEQDRMRREASERRQQNRNGSQQSNRSTFDPNQRNQNQQGNSPFENWPQGQFEQSGNNSERSNEGAGQNSSTRSNQSSRSNESQGNELTGRGDENRNENSFGSPQDRRNQFRQQQNTQSPRDRNSARNGTNELNRRAERERLEEQKRVKDEFRNRMNRILLDAAKESTQNASSRKVDEKTKNAMSEFLSELAMAANKRMKEAEIDRDVLNSMNSRLSSSQNQQSNRMSAENSNASGEGSWFGRGGMITLLMFIAGGSVVVLVLLGLKKQQSRIPKKQIVRKSFAEVQSKVNRINSAGDLVLALDEYVGWRFGYGSAWWHNGQVRHGLLTEHPALQSKIQQLMSTYERARYAPGSLGPDDIELKEGVQTVRELVSPADLDNSKNNSVRPRAAEVR